MWANTARPGVPLLGMQRGAILSESPFQSRNSTVGSLRAIDCLESPQRRTSTTPQVLIPSPSTACPSALSRGGLGLSAAARPCEARSEGCPDVPSSGSCSDRAEARPPFDAGSVYDALGLVAATPAQRIPLVCLPRQCSVGSILWASDLKCLNTARESLPWNPAHIDGVERLIALPPPDACTGHVYGGPESRCGVPQLDGGDSTFAVGLPPSAPPPPDMLSADDRVAAYALASHASSLVWVAAGDTPLLRLGQPFNAA